MKKLITSWDDGHPFDLKIAELLDKYNIYGIFFIPIRNRDGRTVLKKEHIKELSKKFIIGAHTYSHIDLTKVSLKLAQDEIVNGKVALEQIIGKRVTYFCYPRGHFNKRIKLLVKKAGYKYARNARIISFSKGTDNYSVNPHLHIYPHHAAILMGHLVKNRDFKRLTTLNEIYSTDILMMAKRLSKKIKRERFHIWGHSWEVKKVGYMKYLEDIFKHYAK